LSPISTPKFQFKEHEARAKQTKEKNTDEQNRIFFKKKSPIYPYLFYRQNIKTASPKA
jgi:hypothetical protein